MKTEPCAGTAVTAGPSPPVTGPVHVASAATTVKQEQGADHSTHDLIKYGRLLCQLFTESLNNVSSVIVKSADRESYNNAKDSLDFKR